MNFLYFLTVASKFSSSQIAVKVQKKIAGNFAASFGKKLIDDDFSKLLDTIHNIVAAEMGMAKADKLVKNIIKMVVKIAILYKNNRFSTDQMHQGIVLRRKLKSVTMTVVSFHEVDFTYDADFLINIVQEIGRATHELVGDQVTAKSHGRIDNIVSILGDKSILDNIFLSDGKYHDKLEFVSTVFGKVVDRNDW